MPREEAGLARLPAVKEAAAFTSSLSKPRLLVFDLDGTLIDSSRDLGNSVNATLEHFGREPLPMPTIASYIGDGVEALVRRSLEHASRAVEQPMLAEAVAWFIAYYRLHKLDQTTVYPGVLDALGSIRARQPDLPIAILTNKPVRPSQEICRHFGIDRYTFRICGGNSFPTKKPDPEGLLSLVREAGVEASQTVMIGDSHVDMETARNAGARSLGCTFGLAPESLRAAKPDATVDQASEWPLALGLT